MEVPKVLYYLNHNRKKYYTIADFRQGTILFEDDLVWHDKLEDWEEARCIQELAPFFRKRPPLSKRRRTLGVLKIVVIKFFIFYVIFSAAIGVAGALIEKHQFNLFHKQISANFSKNEKIRETQIKNQRLIKNEQRSKNEADINSLKFKIDKIDNIIDDNIIDWKSALHSSTYNFEQVRELSTKHDSLSKAAEVLRTELQDKHRISEDAEFDGSETIRPFSFTLPHDEVFIQQDNGNYSTRWCAYIGDIDQNEHVSYENCHKFLFRPYYAIFSDANLSQDEQDSTLTLVINFIYSSLVSNLPFIFLIFPIYFQTLKNKKRNLTPN